MKPLLTSNMLKGTTDVYIAVYKNNYLQFASVSFCTAINYIWLFDKSVALSCHLHIATPKLKAALTEAPLWRQCVCHVYIQAQYWQCGDAGNILFLFFSSSVGNCKYINSFMYMQKQIYIHFLYIYNCQGCLYVLRANPFANHIYLRSMRRNRLRILPFDDEVVMFTFLLVVLRKLFLGLLRKSI